MLKHLYIDPVLGPNWYFLMSKDSKTTAAEEFAKQGSYSFIGTITSNLLRAIFLLTVTRLVVPESYGIFTVALSVILISGEIFSLNVYKSINYFIPQYFESGDYFAARKFLFAAAVLGILGSTIGMFIMIGIAPLLSNVLDESSLSSIIPLFAIFLPLYSINQLMYNLFSGIKRIDLMFLTKFLASPGLKLLITIFLVIEGYGLYALVFGYILSEASVLFLNFTLALSSAPVMIGYPGTSLPINSVLSYSSPLILAGLLSVAIGQIDHVILGFILERSEPIAVYKISHYLAGLLALTTGTINPILKPMIAESRDSDVKSSSRYKLATKWGLVLSTPLVVTMLTIPEALLRVFFTPDYVSGATSLVILAGGYYINILVGPGGTVIDGYGYTKLTLLNALLSLSVNIVLDIVLIPEFGIVGASVGTGTAIAISGIFELIELYNIRAIHPFSEGSMKILLSGMMTLSVMILLKTIHISDIISVLLAPPLVVFSNVGLWNISRVFTDQDKKIASTLDRSLPYPIFNKFLIWN